MTAYPLAVTAIAHTIMGKPKAKQRVSIETKIYNGSPLGPKYIVHVTPAGAYRGETYEVYRIGLQALQNGMSPEEMELEPYVPDDEDEDYAASRADRLVQARAEGVGL